MKACLKLMSVIEEYWFNVLLKIVLFLNRVEYGEGVKTVRSVPDFNVNLKNGKIKLGSRITFNNYGEPSTNTKCKLMVGANAEIKIADNVGLNGVIIYAKKRVSIGEYTLIGGGTKVFDTDFHNLDWKERRNPQKMNEARIIPVEIGSDVFIGTNCIICKGVHIGEHSIIAAGSVVVKDIPANEVWGGNPAKFIRKVIG